MPVDNSRPVFGHVTMTMLTCCMTFKNAEPQEA
jgi:hypothetical protein